MILRGAGGEPEAVFVHINKTAGTSIHKALGFERFTHYTVREFQQQLGAACWTRLFSFAFVRNPWDRAVSQYLWRIATNQTGMGEQAPSFRDWLVLTLVRQDPDYYNNPKMFMPQRQWLIGESGEVEVSFIGRFERLAEDFAQVSRLLGRATPALPHLKQTERAHYRDYYDRETIRIVGDWFAEDVERFGYGF